MQTFESRLLPKGLNKKCQSQKMDGLLGVTQCVEHFIFRDILDIQM